MGDGRKITNCDVHVKGVTEGRHNDLFSIIQHINGTKYLGMSKRSPLLYCEWFYLTMDVGVRVHLQYNIVEINMSEKYILYDSSIIP